MAAKRIEYIDIAKALLILCLLYGHMFMVARLQGFEDATHTSLVKVTRIYATFFMQAFFLITGLCSSFNKKFGQYLWNNTKTILIPGVTLVIIDRYLYNSLPGNPFEHTPTAIEWLTTGGPWFIFALFEAKLIYWAINKLAAKWQLLIICPLAIICLALARYRFTENYLWYQHTFMMLPYLCFGNLAKKYMDKVDVILPKVAIAGGLLLLVEYFANIPMPHLDYDVSVSMFSFPVHVVNVFAGTFFILWVSKLIGKNTVLLSIGKGTLLIYLMNECVLKAVLQMLSPVYDATSTVACISFYVATYVLVVAIFYILIRVVYGTKYLSWIVGKY